MRLGSASLLVRVVSGQQSATTIADLMVSPAVSVVLGLPLVSSHIVAANLVAVRPGATDKQDATETMRRVNDAILNHQDGARQDDAIVLVKWQDVQVAGSDR
jgi:hypothetical protein